MTELTAGERGATGPAAAASPPSPRSGAVFAVTALAAFMASLDLSIVNIAFPALQRTFSHDPLSSVTWVVSGYAIAFAALLVVMGRTADRLGARRVFFVGLAVFCAASALCGVAPTLLTLNAGRIVQGAGAAMMLPSSLGLLLASVPLERRTLAVARWSGVGALAVATGPTLGALLVTAGGWRWVFYVNLPVGVIAWLAGRAVLPRTDGGTRHAPPDYLGALLAFLSLGTLVFGLTEGSDWGWDAAAVVGSLVAAVLLGALFVRRCATHPEPVLDLSLFRARTFSVANAAMVLYAMGFFAMLLGNIEFLTTGPWHYSILDAGLAVTPGPLVVALVAGPAGRLASRVGFRPVLVTGALLLALGLVLYAVRVGPHPDYLADWLPSTLLTGLGVALTFPVLGATAVSSLPRDRFSVGSAVNQTARQVGGAIGIAALVIVLGSERVVPLSSYRDLWLYVAATSLASGAVCLLLPRRSRAAATAPASARAAGASTATVR